MVHFSISLIFLLLFPLAISSPLPNPQVLDQPTRSASIPTSTSYPSPPGPSHQPPNPQPRKCKPKKRYPWQALSNSQRKAYIKAELCLQKLPTKAGYEAAVSRFDDLIKAHQIQGRAVHNTGYFLPFHRALMHAHEVLLKTECGYTGTQPYWAEELDIGRIEKSELLNPVTGFGGGVLNKTVCIPDGPFKDYVLHTGPGYDNAPEGRCIQRKLNNAVTYGARQEYIDYCYQFDKFEQAWQCLEDGGPHNGFHGGVGAEMNNPISSPGDPIFYMHHTWLDKVWWDWQKQNPARLTDISGRKMGFLPSGNGTGFPGGIGGIPGLPPGFPPGGFPSFNSTGNGGLPFPADFDITTLIDFSGPPNWKPRFQDEIVEDPVQLYDTLNMFGTIADLTVRDVMDIKTGSPLCYEYVDYKDTPRGKQVGKGGKGGKVPKGPNRKWKLRF